MSKIQCIVIEDEPLALKVLTDYIADTPFLQLQGSFKDAILASDHLRDHDTDLIFLDIHLPKLKGIEFLKTLADPPAVIITTAYHQYAVEGFNLNVTDYLLKPFEFSRFLAAVNKVIEYRNLQQESREFIFVSVQKRKVRVVLAEILYIESQREYIKIVTARSEYHSKMGTREMEDLLPPDRFKRIHRSFIVSVGKIDSYTADTIEINGVSIPIGRAYRDVIDKI
jgi:two-component system, LytTR family, response regulator